MEGSLQEILDIKIRFRIKSFFDPIIIREEDSKLHVDFKFNDSDTIKNTAYVNFNVENLGNIRFVKINSMPVVGKHLKSNH